MNTYLSNQLSCNPCSNIHCYHPTHHRRQRLDRQSLLNLMGAKGDAYSVYTGVSRWAHWEHLARTCLHIVCVCAECRTSKCLRISLLRALRCLLNDIIISSSELFAFRCHHQRRALCDTIAKRTAIVVVVSIAALDHNSVSFGRRLGRRRAAFAHSGDCRMCHDAYGTDGVSADVSLGQRCAHLVPKRHDALSTFRVQDNLSPTRDDEGCRRS